MSSTAFSTLKTHSKICLIVRREKSKLVKIRPLGTGNYNRVTSRIYTDLGILTVDEEIERGHRRVCSIS